jgi:hypothetical protein
MIQPLRSVHRRAFLALAAILPTILVVGLIARHRNAPVAGDTREAPERTGGSNVASHWQKHSIDTYFYASPASEGEIAIVLVPQLPLEDPDLLLYWNTDSSADLSQARLLGPFVKGKRYSLPASERRGELMLYSLAHRAVIDHATIEDLP